jgi:predicted nicotinamide N-methyase
VCNLFSNPQLGAGLGIVGIALALAPTHQPRAFIFTDALPAALRNCEANVKAYVIEVPSGVNTPSTHNAEHTASICLHETMQQLGAAIETVGSSVITPRTVHSHIATLAWGSFSESLLEHCPHIDVIVSADVFFDEAGADARTMFTFPLFAV